MRAWFAVALTLAGISPLWAQEPSGCDKFKFPVARERAALTATTLPARASGAELGAGIPASATLTLQPAAEAKLPSPPERAPKPGTFAGFTTVKNIPASGVYTISLSSGGWLDVMQNGVFLKPKGFSGLTGCDGIRKVVTFGLAAGPAIIQISGVAETSIRLAILPAKE